MINKEGGKGGKQLQQAYKEGFGGFTFLGYFIMMGFRRREMLPEFFMGV